MSRRAHPRSPPVTISHIVSWMVNDCDGIIATSRAALDNYLDSEFDVSSKANVAQTPAKPRGPIDKMVDYILTDGMLSYRSYSIANFA
jgi:hypothetical protein